MSEVDSVYRLHDKDFYGDIDTLIDDIEHAIWLDREQEGDVVVTFDIGKPDQKHHSDYICVDHIIDGVRDQAYEDMGELTDGYLVDVDESKKEEIENMLVSAFSKLFIYPTWFGVIDVVEVTYTPRLNGEELDVDHLNEAIAARIGEKK